VNVIKGIDLEVRDGEFLVFVGPSGCGKTTLLRMIAGLESITEGELTSTADVPTTSARPTAARPWCSRAMRCTRT
jgi:ABC-type sugar transport system ATPase subunit